MEVYVCGAGFHADDDIHFAVTVQIGRQKIVGSMPLNGIFNRMARAGIRLRITAVGLRVFMPRDSIRALARLARLPSLQPQRSLNVTVWAKLRCASPNVLA